MGILLIVIFVLIIVLFFMLDMSSPKAKGNMGEIYMKNTLKRHLPKDIYHCMNDVFLHDGQGGTTQVDHIVISVYGIFVIETKNYKGWIFGKLNSQKWKQVNFKKQNYFYNPLRQNYKHTKAISECSAIPMSSIYSIIAFVGDAKFKSSNKPDNVLMGVEEVIDYINSVERPLFSEKESLQFLEYIQEVALPRDKTTKRFHLNYVTRKR